MRFQVCDLSLGEYRKIFRVFLLKMFFFGAVLYFAMVQLIIWMLGPEVISIPRSQELAQGPVRWAVGSLAWSLLMMLWLYFVLFKNFSRGEIEIENGSIKIFRNGDLKKVIELGKVKGFVIAPFPSIQMRNLQGEKLVMVLAESGLSVFYGPRVLKLATLKEAQKLVLSMQSKTGIPAFQTRFGFKRKISAERVED